MKTDYGIIEKKVISDCISREVLSFIIERDRKIVLVLCSICLIEFEVNWYINNSNLKLKISTQTCCFSLYFFVDISAPSPIKQKKICQSNDIAKLSGANNGKLFMSVHYILYKDT